MHQAYYKYSFKFKHLYIYSLWIITLLRIKRTIITIFIKMALAGFGFLKIIFWNQNLSSLNNVSTELHAIAMEDAEFER